MITLSKLYFYGKLVRRFGARILMLLFFTNFALVSGCSVLSPVAVKPTNKYLIDKTPCISIQKTHPYTLLISLPNTRPIFNTVQMAYSTKPFQIAYFSQNEWAETPSHMLQPLLVQTLAHNRYFQAVTMPSSGGLYDYMLNTDILEFKQDYTSRIPVFVFVLRAQLLQTSTGKIVKAQIFCERIPLPQCSPYGGVLAANRAMENILMQITQFVKI